MLTYLNSKTLEELKVIRKEVLNNQVEYHYLHGDGTIQIMNQRDVTTLRYYTSEILP